MPKAVNNVFLPVIRSIFNRVASNNVVRDPFRAVPRERLRRDKRANVVKNCFIMFKRCFARRMRVIHISFLLMVDIRIFMRRVRRAKVFITNDAIMSILSDVRPRSIRASICPSFNAIYRNCMHEKEDNLFRHAVIRINGMINNGLKVVVPWIRKVRRGVNHYFIVGDRYDSRDSFIKDEDDAMFDSYEPEEVIADTS